MTRRGAPLHVVVALSGASGIRYGVRVLRALHVAGARTTVAVTAGAARVAALEEGLRLDPERPDTAALLGETGASRCTAVALSDIAAGPCSGTHPVDAMVVVPCSMGTVARIAAGTSSNFVERAADVVLKEGRPLVLVPRESPVSRIHLENLLRVHDAGAAVVPAAPGFYGRPETIDDLVDQVAGKVLDRLYAALGRSGDAPTVSPRWRAPGGGA